MDVESKIYEICSPFIAKKVILELCRAKEGHYLVQQKTFETYEVVYNNNKGQETKLRIVNIDLLTCTCLRINYFGFCCAHIFAVLLRNDDDIVSLLPSLILDRWRFHQNELSTSMVKESTFLHMKPFKTPSKKKVDNSKGKPVQKGSKVDDKTLVDKKSLKAVKEKTTSLSEITIKPKNPYFLYQEDVKEEFHKKYPQLRWTQIISKIAESYRKLSKVEKEQIEKEAAEMKEKCDSIKYKNKILPRHSQKPEENAPISKFKRVKRN